MIPLAAFAMAACLPVGATDRITTADLAQALPEWASIQPPKEVALAPMPGVVRMVRATEIARFAGRFGLEPSGARDVCFVRPVAPLDPARVLESMQARLPEARVEIVEVSRLPVPEGALDFPLSGLRPGYWYGTVTYGGGRRFAVWARVRIQVRVKRIVAAADLLPGRPVGINQLREETHDEFPEPEKTGCSIGDLVGRSPRRTIREGMVIRCEWLHAPRLVQRGEMVTVEVQSGRARLESSGVAEGSGSLGDIIAVQNPDSKRRFRARVEARGRVSVKAGL